ncbi:hypothetical protein H0I23_12550 [Cellulophaga sp. HaHaR_3_176]|uniref:hypothetical protein n=1 Tax=Cellulophaga sp. HaHaR_3_176 TaxID=1942464 RepID=UPI001C200C91|nr:hypothetical protein [Cellulophaga sp. HaHaR_3_176]QWX83276.1 hypothetical protein H0I23_12550 [Cellulophaga sp. HaHaR_3_176]
MKKIFIASVFLLTSFVTFAQDNEVEAEPIEVVGTSQDGFKEIMTGDLPEAVFKATAKDYSAAIITQSSVNEKGQYKLELFNEGGTSSYIVYVDKNGKWLNM